MNVPNHLEQVIEFLNNGGYISVREKKFTTDRYEFGFQTPGEVSFWYDESELLGIRAKELFSDSRLQTVDRNEDGRWKDLLLTNPQPEPEPVNLVKFFDVIDAWALARHQISYDEIWKLGKPQRDQIELLLIEGRQRDILKLKDALGRGKKLYFLHKYHAYADEWYHVLKNAGVDVGLRFSGRVRPFKNWSSTQTYLTDKDAFVYCGPLVGHLYEGSIHQAKERGFEVIQIWS